MLTDALIKEFEQQIGKENIFADETTGLLIPTMRPF